MLQTEIKVFSSLQLLIQNPFCYLYMHVAGLANTIKSIYYHISCISANFQLVRLSSPIISESMSDAATPRSPSFIPSLASMQKVVWLVTGMLACFQWFSYPWWLNTGHLSQILTRNIDHTLLSLLSARNSFFACTHNFILLSFQAFTHRGSR